MTSGRDDYWQHLFGAMAQDFDKSKIAFEASQTYALFAERTLVVINSGAVGFLVLLVSSGLASMSSLLLSASLFILGTILAVLSCFGSYFNLSYLTDCFEKMARQAGDKVAFQYQAPDSRIEALIKSRDEEIQSLQKKIALTQWAALGLIGFSFVAFFAGCYSAGVRLS